MGELVTTDAWVTLVKLLAPHGVKGALKAKPFTSPPDAFATYPLTDDQGNPVSLTITGGTAAAPIVQVQGVNDRNEAELWRNKMLGVLRSQLKPAAKDTHYASDLIGMQVFDKEGKKVGTVDRVLNFGAGDILDIAFTDGTQEMFAFTGATFPSIDKAARRITLIPPEVIGSKEEEGDGA